MQLLQTIPGVGRKTAEVVVAYLDDPHRFQNARQVSSYAGMVPRRYQSGEMDRQGRIHKRGPRQLRSALVEAAWLMLRYNPWAEVGLRPADQRAEDPQEEGDRRRGS